LPAASRPGRDGPAHTGWPRRPQLPRKGGISMAKKTVKKAAKKVAKKVAKKR
jgi:hypothetical protein